VITGVRSASLPSSTDSKVWPRPWLCGWFISLHTKQGWVVSPWFDVQSGVWVRRGKPGPGACVAQGGRGRARFGPPPRFLSLTRLSHISEQQQQVYTEKENPEGGPAARSPTRLLLVAARAAAAAGGGSTRPAVSKGLMFIVLWLSSFLQILTLQEGNQWRHWVDSKKGTTGQKRQPKDVVFEEGEAAQRVR
jgi:hypothetical protein